MPISQSEKGKLISVFGRRFVAEPGDLVLTSEKTIGLGLFFKRQGFIDHEGRPGKVGGSLPRAGDLTAAKDRNSLPAHIKALVIPPAWTDLRYNKDPNGDLLVTGKDSKGRLQYVYSERFYTQQAEAKFERVKELSDKYGSITKQNEKNRKSKDPEIREHADCLKLIMETGMRPGSDKDTGADKKAYGATTLLGKHVKEKSKGVKLDFVGKKGVSISITVYDPELTSMLISRAKKAGPKGKLFDLTAQSLTKYTHSLDGGSFKTKDFRTRLANEIAMEEVRKVKTKPRNMKDYKKMVKGVAKTVAAQLGNTPTVALQSYISPSVFTAWRANL